ncbi:hypothetical protein [Fodinibius sp. AD559]
MDENKLLVVYFTASWCRICAKKLARTFQVIS